MRRRLLVPALSTAVMLAILVSLGVWQVHRLAWKRGILAEIAAAEAAPAVPLGPDTLPSRFQKVAATGRLLSGDLAYWGSEVRDTGRGTLLGAQLIVPLLRPQGPPLLVDLGWVPTAPPGALDLPTGTVTEAGYAHPPASPGWFTPADDPKTRSFYTLDPRTIAAALRLGEVAPFVLVVLGPPPTGGGWPIPATSLPRPPNNHLQYAATWFGLAAALVVVFALYVRRMIADDRR